MKKQIKIKHVDDQFSLFIRNRDGWICQVCGNDFSQRRRDLHNSHFHSRSIMSTRFDPINCDALCKACHRRWESRKTAEYGDWKKLRLGLKKFNSLKARAYQTEYIKIGGYSQEDRRKLMEKFKT